MFENVLNVAVIQKDPKIQIFSKTGSLLEDFFYLLYMDNSSSFLLVAQILMAAQGRGTK